MPQRTASPGLASLSRRFTAEFRGDQLAEKFPGTIASDLIRRGVLVDAGFVLTIGDCICELQRGDCHVRVDVQDGVHYGYCNEAGRPIPISPDRLQRYIFDWKAWASWLRRRTGLDGAGPTLGAGALFVGNGRAAGREFGLVVVAPGCRRAADMAVPEGVRQEGRPLVGLLLGEPVEALPVDATVSVAALGRDFGTIDTTTIERALDAVPVVVARGDLAYVCHCRESPRGRRIDQSECDRLSRPEVRDTFDLFIDLPAGKVWRKGRREQWVRDAQGQSKKKRLGPLGVGLLADYVRHPGRAMTAKETQTYRGRSTDAHSASVQLGEVRRSVRAQGFIVPGARKDKFGELPYLFEPGGMSWCLLERPGA